MSKRITLLFLLLTSSLYSQNGWQQVSSLGSSQMAGIYFVTDSIGYAAGDKVGFTTNGGYNWTSNYSSPRKISVHFANPLTGWTCGITGSIQKTTNGGLNWVNQTSGVTDVLNGLFFVNENTGWIAGGDFSVEKLIKTTNGGVNWFLQSTGTSQKLFDVFFVNENTGWVVGNASSQKIYKTTNGGTNWFNQTSGSTPALYSVYFINENTGWACGTNGSGAIIKTTNGGINWTTQVSNWFGSGTGFFCIHFVNDSIGFASGGNGSNSGGIAATTNGGLNWFAEAISGNPHVPGIFFRNAQTGWAISGNGNIFKTTNGGMTAVSPISNNIPSDFKLYQNYPNPFNPATKIRFSIPLNVKRETLDQSGAEGSNVKLSIYDILGKEVANLIPPLGGGQEGLEPGFYEIVWDASNYPSGIYFYKLEINNFSQTNIMVLLK